MGGFFGGKFPGNSVEKKRGICYYGENYFNWKLTG